MRYVWFVSRTLPGSLFQSLQPAGTPHLFLEMDCFFDFVFFLLFSFLTLLLPFITLLLHSYYLTT